MVKNNFLKYLEEKKHYISCAWQNCNFGALAQMTRGQVGAAISGNNKIGCINFWKKKEFVGFSISLATAR